MQMTEHKWDFVAGLLLAIIFLIFLFVINDISVEVPLTAHESESSNAITPRTFPDAICWSVVAFSLGLMASSWLRIRDDQKNPDSGPATYSIDGMALATQLASIGTLLFLFFVADWLGILLGGCLFYLLFAFFTGERKPLRALLGSILTTVTLYYLFVKLASVPLPLGILEGIV